MKEIQMEWESFLSLHELIATLKMELDRYKKKYTELKDKVDMQKHQLKHISGLLDIQINKYSSIINGTCRSCRYSEMSEYMTCICPTLLLNTGKNLVSIDKDFYCKYFHEKY